MPDRFTFQDFSLIWTTCSSKLLVCLYPVHTFRCQSALFMTQYCNQSCGCEKLHFEKHGVNISRGHKREACVLLAIRGCQDLVIGTRVGDSFLHCCPLNVVRRYVIVVIICTFCPRSSHNPQTHTSHTRLGTKARAGCLGCAPDCFKTRLSAKLPAGKVRRPTISSPSFNLRVRASAHSARAGVMLDHARQQHGPIRSLVL